MTRDQIAIRIRDNLNDNGITYYSVTDINDSIQDAYDEVAVYCECIEKDYEIPLVANTTYYDISNLIPDYYRPTRIYNNQIKQFISSSLGRQLHYYRNDWELIQGNVNDFVVIGSKYIGFSGRNLSVLGTIKISYKAQANVLSSASTPFINSNYQILLELYATADLLEQNQEYSKAQIYWNQYDAILDEYRDKIQLLAKSDRVFTRY